jgi:hypothetical protein
MEVSPLLNFRVKTAPPAADSFVVSLGFAAVFVVVFTGSAIIGSTFFPPTGDLAGAALPCFAGAAQPVMSIVAKSTHITDNLVKILPGFIFFLLKVNVFSNVIIASCCLKTTDFPLFISSSSIKFCNKIRLPVFGRNRL